MTFRSGRNNRIASNSVMRRCPLHDRSSTESGSQLAMLRCRRSSNSRLMHRSKQHLFDHFVSK